MCIVICTLLLSRPARGAWVEISKTGYAIALLYSRAPQGARGLKFCKDFNVKATGAVAPRKGRVG